MAASLHVVIVDYYRTILISKSGALVSETIAPWLRRRALFVVDQRLQVDAHAIARDILRGSSSRALVRYHRQLPTVWLCPRRDTGGKSPQFI